MGPNCLPLTTTLLVCTNAWPSDSGVQLIPDAGPLGELYVQQTVYDDVARSVALLDVVPAPLEIKCGG